MKYVIIGGVAGGATAAARIRRIDEKNDIILFEKGAYISYANCGLPYYIGGTIQEREKLFVQTPALFGLRFNVDVRVNSEVIAIDREKKEVVVRGRNNKEYREAYDKLLLSPGASPIVPPLPGIEGRGIFTLRNVADTDAVKSYMNTHPVKKAVIIGGGFIGLEMAENLHASGMHVSIVEKAGQVMAPVDFSMAQLVHQHLMQKKVDLYLNDGVVSFDHLPDNKLVVNLESGHSIEADMVILSIGVRPNTALAKAAGIETGVTGGIKVNEYLQTNDKDIYAVGDAIEYPHPLTGQPWLNYLAVPANRQGRLVADNLVKGNVMKYEGAIGTAIAKVFDLTVATTGLPAKRLSAAEMEFASSTTHSMSHAGYYPGALPLTVKITFNPVTGKLLGGQIVGYQGVDKRIDEIALVIKRGGTIYDLTEIEHAYAPPFSSAKDPVNIAGYAAVNILEKSVKPIYWRELEEKIKTRNGGTPYTLLDVRTQAEFELGHIEGAVNIPLDEIRDIVEDCDNNGGCDLPTRFAEILHPDREIIVHCAIGLRGYLAYRILAQSGYKNVRNLVGGYKTYSVSTAPVTICSKGDCETLPGSNDTERGITPASGEKENRGRENGGDAGVKTVVVDACGLQCPGPVMELKRSMDRLQPGERVQIISTDAGFMRDAGAWCNSTGNRLIEKNENGGKCTVLIEKGRKEEANGPAAVCNKKGGKTFILFSDDLDKALATFVLANGAAATGEKVTLFFTFWGLNVIKQRGEKGEKKDIFARMFAMMLPSGSLGLKLSKMNMWGMGRRMMRYIMQKKGISSLESLMAQAVENGVEFIACRMSMDVMGISESELPAHVTIGGVATYMERADHSNVNLFI